MDEQKSEIVQLFRNYAADFSHMWTQPILYYFCRPCTVIAPQGVFTLMTDVEIEQLLESMFENLKAQGYIRSEWLKMQVKLMDENIAMASNVAAYYDGEGKEIERAGGTYVLHRSDGFWKISVIIVHGPDQVLSLP